MRGTRIEICATNLALAQKGPFYGPVPIFVPRCLALRHEAVD
jgi:hypothetical protein